MWNVNDYVNDPILDEEGKEEMMNHEYDIPGLSDYDHEPNMEYRLPEPPSFLIEYVRKTNRDKRGVMMAVKHDDNKIVIGWSLCCPKDVFNKYFGQEVAYERGAKRFYDDAHFEDIPSSILPKLDRFISRCKKYFKDCEFPAWTV